MRSELSERVVGGRSTPQAGARPCARRRALMIALVVLLSLFLAFVPAAPVARADARLETFRELLDQLAQVQLQGGWSRGETRRMMALINRAEGLGLRLPLDHTLVRRQNALVQNMHDFLAFKTQHLVGGEAAMIRVGKHPEHARFGGLASLKPSDFDVTYAGRAEAAAKRAHLWMAELHFGKEFADVTRMVIAEADSSLAAQTVMKVKDAFNRIAIRPDLHRTYSGLRMVDDYILKTGSITTLENGRLVSIRHTDFAKADDFARALNQRLQRVGSACRIGGWQRGFALGHVSDVLRQIELNVGRGEVAHLVKKKYLDRYLMALEEVGERFDPVRLARLRSLADTRPKAFIPAFGKFQKEVVQRVARAQRVAYNEALRSGLKGRAEIIMADSAAAMYHFEKHGYKQVARESLEEVGEAVARELKRNPFQDVGEFLVETNFERLPKSVRFLDRWSVREYLKRHPLDAAIRVGVWLFTLKTLWDAGTCGDDSRFTRALWETAATVALFDGVPLAMNAMGMSKAAAAYGTVSFAVLAAAILFKFTGDYVVGSFKRAQVDKKSIRAFCGVDLQGRDIGLPDLMDELGVGLRPEDLAAPGRIELGESNNGKVIIKKSADGRFTFRSLRSKHHEAWDGGDRESFLGWFDERSINWNESSLMAGHIVAQHRMRRVYDKLRRAYLQHAKKNAAGTDDYPPRVYVPELGTHMDNQGMALTVAEFAFYRRRFLQAWESGPFRWSPRASSIHGGIDEGIRRAVLLSFLQQMMRYAQENERAIEYYEGLDLDQLTFWIQTGVPIRFDGRTVTEQELRERLDSLTADVVRGHGNALPAWLEHIRGQAADTTPEDEVLDEGWYVLKYDMVYVQFDPNTARRKKFHETWYAPKKARNRVKKGELLARARKQLQEKAEQRRAISSRVVVVQGPFRRIPRDLPAATKTVLGDAEGP